MTLLRAPVRRVASGVASQSHPLKQWPTKASSSLAAARSLSGTSTVHRPRESRPSYAPLASSSQIVVGGETNDTFVGLDSSYSPTRSAIVVGDSTTENVVASELPPIFRRERRQAQKAKRKEFEKKKAKENIFHKMGLSADKVSPYVRKDRQFKTFKPLTPSLRWVRTALNPYLYKGRPERALTMAKRGKGGRNHHGHLTVRGRGGGHRRRLRLVDFFRWESGKQKVLRIEYDPNRTAHIALIEHSQTGARSYILATEGLREGDVVQSYRSGVEGDEAGSESSTAATEQGATPAAAAGASAASGASSSLNLGIFRTKAIRPGNVLPLKLIPVGTTIHAISFLPGGAAKMIRSAGGYGQLVAFANRSKAAPSSASSLAAVQGGSEMGRESAVAAGEESGDVTSSTSNKPATHAQVKLQSGEVRLVPVGCCATIGRVSNSDHEHERIGKAGRSRWMGRRPKVRGVAMNAVDHPHGGGRGKSKSNMHPRSIYGQKTKGPRTRKPGTKNGNQMVVRERPRRNGKRAGKP